jgi:hypothetical protein
MSNEVAMSFNYPNVSLRSLRRAGLHGALAYVPTMLAHSSVAVAAEERLVSLSSGVGNEGVRVAAMEAHPYSGAVDGG